MNYRSIVLATLASVIVGPAYRVDAQMFNPNPPLHAPYTRPALSPYLNLLRGGDPAANYYLGVLPEFDRRYQQVRMSFALDNLATQVATNRALEDRNELELPLYTPLPPTGHSSGFMIYQAYYNIPGTRGYIPYNPTTTGRQTGQTGPIRR